MKSTAFILLLALACLLVSASAQSWRGALPSGCVVVDDDNVNCVVSCSDGSSYDIFCDLDDVGDIDDFGDDDGFCRFGANAKTCSFTGSNLDCPGWTDVAPGPCHAPIGALLRAFQFTSGYLNDWDDDGDDWNNNGRGDWDDDGDK